MIPKPLDLVVDMYGCPNRCLHCWIGHMPNRRMRDGDDRFIVDFFRPYFDRIAFYSWLREPDYCDDYRERWEKDLRLSVNEVPKRFELASFWRIVRDPSYVPFLREVGVRRVQLTFFGLEALTDKYVGRKGAFRELLQATELLLAHRIAPRWQAFINEENKDELVELLRLSETLRLRERCEAFGEEFRFFVHEGSCDGENRKLYGIRICKGNVPAELKPYYLGLDRLASEREWVERLRDDSSRVTFRNADRIVLQISNRFDVYFNFSEMSDRWKIGNLKTDAPDELVRRVVEEDVPALCVARNRTVGELAARYGDPHSERLFARGDYEEYLLNLCLYDQSIPV